MLLGVDPTPVSKTAVSIESQLVGAGSGTGIKTGGSLAKKGAAGRGRRRICRFKLEPNQNQTGPVLKNGFGSFSVQFDSGSNDPIFGRSPVRTGS